MDNIFSDGPYEESQEQTRRYQKLLESFLREDLAALVEEGHLDDAIEKRVLSLAEEGRLGPELKEAASRIAAKRRRRHKRRDVEAPVPRKQGPVLIGILLVAAGAVGGWLYLHQPSDTSSPVGVLPSSSAEAGSTADEGAGTPQPSQELTLEEVLARVDSMLLRNSADLQPLLSRLPSGSLDGALERFREGTATETDRARVRRAMTQLILRDRGTELGRIDGLYGRGCSGSACPAITQDWRERSRRSTDRIPAFPSDISEDPDSLIVRMEAYEKALIAEYLGLWENLQ